MKNELDFYDKTSLKTYNLDSSMRYQLNILGTLDVFTRKHSENVASITCRICEYLHCSKEFTVYCTICAYLHDIGKVFIPSSILQKNDELTSEEYEIMKTHTTIGYEMCFKDIKLRPYVAGPLYHHEALNGTGYPNGVSAKKIPIEGQIIRVADEFDAISSKRQYKSHINIVDTLKILIQNATPAKGERYGKLNKEVLRCLFKVVIDDTEYEASQIFSYVDYLKGEIIRLKQIDKYNKKRIAQKREAKKAYYEEGMKILFKPGETIGNYKDVLNEYETALINKKNEIDKLLQEVKNIKKLKV